MKGSLGQHMNEVVSLAIMALMVVALIAGQADATMHAKVKSDAHFSATDLVAILETESEPATTRADVVIRLNLDRIIGTDAASRAVDLIGELIDIQLTTDE